MASIENFKQEHPYISSVFREDWTFWWNSYIGGKSYADANYIFQHVSETGTKFSKRKQRAFYLNYCRTIIDVYTGHIFKKQITRTTKNEELKLFWSNVDFKNNTIQDFLKDKVSPMSQVFGQCFVLVDKPNPKNIIIQSKQQEIDNGIRPYLSVISPINVLDFSFDQVGNLMWIKFKKENTDMLNYEDKRSPAAVEYYYYDTTQWIKADGEGTVIDGGTYDLGMNPVVPIFNKENIQYENFGLSEIVDIAPINRAIYNYTSLLDEFLYEQCFPTLVIPESPDSSEATKIIGSDKALGYNPTSAPPSYISPSTDPAEFIMKTVISSIAEIYRIAKLTNKVAGSGGTAESRSGLAKAYDWMETHAEVVKKAKNLEQAERKIVEVFCAWQKQDPSEVSIAYPIDYDIRTFNEELDSAIKLTSMNISPTFELMIKKKLVRMFFPSISPQEEKTVYSEVDASSSLVEQIFTKTLEGTITELELIGNVETKASISDQINLV